MKDKIALLREKYGKFEGIFRFVVVLLAAHFFWKFTVVGDENGAAAITFFGANISAPFDWMSLHIAEMSHMVLGWFGMDTYLFNTSVIHPSNNHGCRIIWACTGLKQAFIFTMILLFSRGIWYHKLWYILLGLVAVYFVNLVRIILIVAAMRDYSEYFHLLHEHIFKYLFYVIIFMIWVLWEDFLVPRLKR